MVIIIPAIFVAEDSDKENSLPRNQTVRAGAGSRENVINASTWLRQASHTSLLSI
jgi:hypothetical protein